MTTGPLLLHQSLWSVLRGLSWATSKPCCQRLRETSVSPDREQHLHTEHWSTSGLCAQSTAVHFINHIITFTDDMTVVSLFSKNDELAFRKAVKRLKDWCESTTEQDVDVLSEHSPLNVDGSYVETIKNTKFLGQIPRTPPGPPTHHHNASLSGMETAQ